MGMKEAATVAAAYAEGWRDVQALYARACISTAPSGVAIRSGVERGDPFAVVSGRAMLSQIDAGEAVGAAHLSVLAAGADHPVTDDPGSPDDQVGIVIADTDGQDADTVEHERQSRLSRWQRLPGE